MNKLLNVLPSLCLLFASCAGSDQKDEQKKIGQGELSSRVDDSRSSSVDSSSPLLTIPANWLAQLPDTNRSFPDLKSLFAYIEPIKVTLLRMKTNNDKVLEFDFSDTALAVKRALDNAVSVLALKHARKWNDSKDGLILLELHANISTLEKLALFDQLPQNIRESSIGKRVHGTLMRYTYDRNLDFDFTAFNSLQVEHLDGRTSALKDLLRHPQKFTLLVFGASWCRPCKIQERDLKKRYAQTVDTTSIKVIGISIDANSSQFRKYINEEDFPWRTYRINGGEENPVFKRLGLTGVPRNFLLASDGKILKEDLDVFEVLK